MTRQFSFIGVTTGKSAIMRVFPAWARYLRLGDVDLTGYDLPIHAPADDYRRVVEALRSDPNHLGGLVTTHKIDLFRACQDMFDFVDPYAELCGEVSSLSKSDGLFRAHAKDPISSGRAIDEFVPVGYWASTGAAALLFGAGGSNLAISLHLMTGRPEQDRPTHLVVVNRTAGRLESMRSVHSKLGAAVEVTYIQNTDPQDNARLLASMAPGSLIVNGTGMGKDSPGSPLPHDARFPEGSRVWELNYRGELGFLRQAERRAEHDGLVVVDGWRYFVHGWSCVVEEVFGVEMTPDVVEQLSEIALPLR